MFERFQRSWELVKPSVGVLMTDKHLLVFPLLSGICMLMVFLTFLQPAISMGVLEAIAEKRPLPSAEAYALLFLVYFLTYLVITFFNCALIGAAMIRFEGGEPTLADGFGIALEKLPALFGFSFICAAVSVVLQALEERVAPLGRIVTGLIGLTWTVTSFLVIPVIIKRDVGPIDALRQSAEMLRYTWGENLIGQLGFEMATCAGCSVVAFAGLTVYMSGAIEMLTMILLIYAGLLLVFVSVTAVKAIYSAALYRYATQGDAGEYFENDVLARAFAGAP